MPRRVIRPSVFQHIAVNRTLVFLVLGRPVEREIVTEPVGRIETVVERDPGQIQSVNVRRVRVRTGHPDGFFFGGRLIAVGVDRGQTVGAGAVDVFAVVKNPGRERRIAVGLRQIVRSPGLRRPRRCAGGPVFQDIAPDLVHRVVRFVPAFLTGGCAPVEGELVGQIVRSQVRILCVSGIDRLEHRRNGVDGRSFRNPLLHGDRFGHCGGVARIVACLKPDLIVSGRYRTRQSVRGFLLHIGVGMRVADPICFARLPVAEIIPVNPAFGVGHIPLERDVVPQLIRSVIPRIEDKPLSVQIDSGPEGVIRRRPERSPVEEITFIPRDIDPAHRPVDIALVDELRHDHGSAACILAGDRRHLEIIVFIEVGYPAVLIIPFELGEVKRFFGFEVKHLVVVDRLL